jgi:hypothetical protein
VIREYGPYLNHQKRWIIVFWDDVTDTHTSQSYPRYLMEKHLGRNLLENEQVHHIDENKDNNEISNLEVLTKDEHLSKHGVTSYKMCPVCEMIHSNEKFCSDKCRGIGTRKVERPSKEELSKAMETLPFTWLGRLYGVSDNSVRKWARQYNLL